MNVFIGGSRAISRLNPVVRNRLDDLIERRCTIFVGDANGADKAVQQHLAKRQYARVVVYCMEECRNNVGQWPTRKIQRPGMRKDFAYYAVKDVAMAQDAQCGLMLWDGKSKGTLQNILNLVGEGKRTLVFFAPTKDFRVVANESDLQALLANCTYRDVESAARNLGLKAPATQSRIPLT